MCNGLEKDFCYIRGRFHSRYDSYLSRNMTKPTKWPVSPAKTQISLGIRPVWSESSLSTWRNLGSLVTHWAHSKDSDQTGRMHRLIWVFAGRTYHFVGFVMRRLTFKMGVVCTCFIMCISRLIAHLCLGWFQTFLQKAQNMRCYLVHPFIFSNLSFENLTLEQLLLLESAFYVQSQTDGMKLCSNGQKRQVKYRSVLHVKFENTPWCFCFFSIWASSRENQFSGFATR